MESKGGKKKSSSNSLQYEVPLGYSIEDVRPNGEVKKFQSAAYSNVMNLKISIIQVLFKISMTILMDFNLLRLFGVFCSALGSLLDKLAGSSFNSAGISLYYSFDSTA